MSLVLVFSPARPLQATSSLSVQSVKIKCLSAAGSQPQSAEGLLLRPQEEGTFFIASFSYEEIRRQRISLSNIVITFKR